MNTEQAESRTEKFAGLAILLGAAVLRFLLLDIKPPHFDEGVNGWFVDQMTQTGFYNYDPSNYHGPLHFYILWVFQTLFGRNLWALRIPEAIISTASVFLTLRFGRFIGRRASLWAALFLAVSPACVFYGRYAIHESWLTFFLMLGLLGFFVLYREGSRKGLALIVTGIAGMFLTKETALIHVVTLALACGCLLLWEMVVPSTDREPPAKPAFPPQDWINAALAVVLALLVFYSGLFLNMKGVGAFFESFVVWTKTGTEGGEGGGHAKPAYYWLTLLARYEWPALLGLAFAPLCALRESRATRLLAILGVGTLLAYSLVSYKTPWCAISFLWIFLLLAGCALDRITTRTNLAPLGAILGVALAGYSLLLSARLNFYHYTDESEPYVYVQTFNDIHKITDPLLALAKRDPRAFDLHGKIVLESSYPLPWILGEFTGIGYYKPEDMPDKLDADFIVVPESNAALAEELLQNSYFSEKLRLRSAQEPSRVYFEASKFARFFPRRTPDLQRKHRDERP